MVSGLVWWWSESDWIELRSWVVDEGKRKCINSIICLINENYNKREIFFGISQYNILIFFYSFVHRMCIWRVWICHGVYCPDVEEKVGDMHMCHPFVLYPSSPSPCTRDITHICYAGWKWKYMYICMCVHI